ncbi:hypothetical protein [Tepidimonas charontis]|uniref:Uncharacterized protein n=1 Tax=Tepidimonas charontis TaxID=2267262 RepID=A0A554XH47_9BURK|nr:hypothetical protein [Tepidimonas charontis]TSE35154.1 hypothetical protein Tchar_00943 [Tepidimonas charontis]
MTTPSVVNVFHVEQKSVLAAFLLTFFFGPLGLLYATVTGGVIMIAAFLAIGVLSFLTLGMASILVLPAWIICVVWGVMAASKAKPRVIEWR